MILLRKAYRGHYIEIRPAGDGELSGAGGHVRVWVDGIVLATAPYRRSAELPALLHEATGRIDALMPLRA